jgi:hypothetical protein
MGRVNMVATGDRRGVTDWQGWKGISEIAESLTDSGSRI